MNETVVRASEADEPLKNLKQTALELELKLE